MYGCLCAPGSNSRQRMGGAHGVLGERRHEAPLAQSRDRERSVVLPHATASQTGRRGRDNALSHEGVLSVCQRPSREGYYS